MQEKKESNAFEREEETMFKSEYAQRVYDATVKKHTSQKEYLQAVKEVLESLEPVIAANPLLEKRGVLERIVEPERQITFRVVWSNC